MASAFSPHIAKSAQLNLACHPARTSVDFKIKPRGEVVYLVDDDPCVGELLSSLLGPCKTRVVCFTTAADYLDHNRSDAAACLILDARLRDGIDLHPRIDRSNPPIIFISSQVDIPTAVRAMKAGVTEFLTKPVDPEALLAAIAVAFAQDRRVRQRKADMDKLQVRLSRLTPREREVLPLVVGGMLNKQAAALLDISEVTLQIHRSQIMRKMAAESFAELVRMAMKLRIRHWCDAEVAERGQFLSTLQFGSA